MIKIFTCMSMLVCMCTAQIVGAQTEKDSLNLEVEKIKNNVEDEKASTIELLKAEKEGIIKEEKAKLTEAVKTIVAKEEKGEITAEEAQKQKEAAAKLAAENIENKTAIIENKIALAERGEYYQTSSFHKDGEFRIVLGDDDDEEDKMFGFSYSSSYRKHKEKKYDKRTRTDLVIAFGLNNAIVEGEGIDGTPYEIGGSRFFEIGHMWSTRLFEDTNFVRFRYGFSFQFNGLNPTDNMYFVDEGDQTVLMEHPYNLKKAKLRMDNLVAPLFFEFGPSRKVERENYFRYSTTNRFKFAIGAYAGLNYSTRQKLKYKADGDRTKEKIKNDYNTNNFIYGLAGYIGVDDVSFYVKYDLNPVFNNAPVKQNNVSLGVRFDL